MIELKILILQLLKKISFNFSKKNETYFLNGMWGSGKTVFKKFLRSFSPSKLIELKLWEIKKDERSVIEIAFSQLYRFTYWTIKVWSSSSGCDINFDDPTYKILV